MYYCYLNVYYVLQWFMTFMVQLALKNSIQSVTCGTIGERKACCSLW